MSNNTDKVNLVVKASKQMRALVNLYESGKMDGPVDVDFEYSLTEAQITALKAMFVAARSLLITTANSITG